MAQVCTIERASCSECSRWQLAAIGQVVAAIGRCLRPNFWMFSHWPFHRSQHSKTCSRRQIYAFHFLPSNINAKLNFCSVLFSFLCSLGGGKRVVLVFFIGGVTHAEVAALRWLSNNSTVTLLPHHNFHPYVVSIFSHKKTRHMKKNLIAFSHVNTLFLFTHCFFFVARWCALSCGHHSAHQWRLSDRFAHRKPKCFGVAETEFSE